MSFPRSHPPLKWMKQFKAVAIDYEYYLTLSDKPESICLSERQMYVLSVQNTYTYWLTRWYNTDDITQKTVEFIAAEIEGLLMCGCGVPQPSITDILNAQTYNNTTSAIYNTTYNTWNDNGQTIESIAPNLDYGIGNPADISKTVCFALSLLLEAIRAQQIQIKQGTQADAQDLTKQLAAALGGLGTAAGAGILVGGSIGTLVAFLGGPWLVLGLALGAVGLTIAGIVIPMDAAVFEDDTAAEEVMCVIGENLSGAPLTRAAFIGALAGASFAPGSNAEQLAAVMQTYLNDLNTYLQLLVSANELYSAVDFDVLPTCPCEPLEDCFDLTTSAFDWYPAYANGAPSTDTGVWTAGQGLGPYVYPGPIPQFFWAKEQVDDQAISSMTINLNQTVTTFRIGKIGGAAIDYSGPATTTITFSEETHPEFFPVSFELNILYMTFPTNLAPNGAFRVAEVCYVFV